MVAKKEAKIQSQTPIITGVVALFLVATLYWLNSSTNSKPESTQNSAQKIVTESLPPPKKLEIRTASWSASKSTNSDKLTCGIAAENFNEETFNEQAGHQWKALQKLITSGKEITANSLAEFATEQFSGTPLRPGQLQTSYERPGTKILRQARSENPTKKLAGRAGLAKALDEFLAPWTNRTTLRIKFKLFRVIHSQETITTHQYVGVNGPSENGFLESNALWITHWIVPAAKAGQSTPDPLLVGVKVENYEEVQSPGGQMFADCTRAVLGNNDCFEPQLLPGNEHWLVQEPRFDPNGYQGMAVADVNNDGLDDLYLCQGYGLPNRLFLQNADGTATDVSQKAGVDWKDLTRSALLIDLDNDGDQDLVVGSQSALLLMENTGDTQFRLRLKFDNADNAFSLSSVDYDNDGDLDLYVCRYYADGGQRGAIAQPETYHDSNNGGRNILFRNNGEWRFTDVTKRVGLDVDNQRYSFAGAWEDYDNDGDQDLYVANDFGRNNLYRNDQGRFINVAKEIGVEDQSLGMSVAWGDYDRDGWMDLYISNMFSAAGNRVTYQPRFKQGASEELKQQLQYLARGNSLFRNTGRGTFRDVSQQAAVMMGRWSWGSQFADLNNDGWDDLVVSNGYLTRTNSGDL